MSQTTAQVRQKQIRFSARSGRSTLILLLNISLFAGSQCIGGTKSRLVEVSDDTTTYVGKLVAKDSDSCVLMDQSGVLSDLPISQLKTFKVVSESFRPTPTNEFRQSLLREFKSGYEVKASAHYLVCGRKGRTEACSALFEEIFRQVDSFYSIRGFDTSDPDVPLVAIVFGTQAEFKAYCERDEMKWNDTLRGYYSLKTNRVALYDDPTLINSAPPAMLKPVSATSEAQINSSERLIPESSRQLFQHALSTVEGETASTIIHETTHQVGYNIGIHSRIGTTPTWLVEGLATVLEAPGMRIRGKSAVGTKVNSGRLDWFKREYESRRNPGDLARMIASDEMFGSETLDAYSSAWAFTFFMTENPARARQFIGYLKTVSDRDPLIGYTADERLKDFIGAFGDIAKLEVDMMRTIDRTESP